MALFGEYIVRCNGPGHWNLNNSDNCEEDNMAEQTVRSGTGETSHGETLRSFSEHAIEASRELIDKGADLAGGSGDRLKDRASDLANEGKELAETATETIKETVSDNRDAGAAYVSSLAQAIRRAGKEFDNELPLAGTYIRQAASQVENVAGSIRTGSFNDLIRNARAFAQRQPTAFVGIAALAGFAAVRFLKSSSSGGEARRERPRRSMKPSGYGSWNL